MKNKRSGQESEGEKDAFDVRIMKMPSHGSLKITTEISIVADDDEIENVHKPIGMVVYQLGHDAFRQNGKITHNRPAVLIILFDAGDRSTPFTIVIEDPDKTDSPQAVINSPIQMGAGKDVYILPFMPKKATSNGITFTLNYNGASIPSIPPLKVVVT